MLSTVILSLAILGGTNMSEQSPVNLALQAKASASEDFGARLRPEFANDGDPKTRWSGISGHNEGVWFQLDWPKPVTLRQVVIQQYDTFVKELDLQVWDPGKGDWRTIQHFGKPTEKLPLVIAATFDPVETTRIRIGNITNGPSFTEVEAYSEPVPPVSVLGSDANGNVIGMVCDRWGRAPIGGASVRLKGTGASGPWQAQARSDAHGLFSLPMPLGLHGPLQTLLEVDGSKTETTQPAEDLQYGLTPIGTAQKTVSLNGKWRFAIDPPAGFQEPAFDDSKWSDISVPAHWEMQGFRSLKGMGGYRRHFRVPAGGGRLKLRFDGVYSGAEVWLNGRRVAYHEGGALPFEVDVSDEVMKGGNLLALKVTEHTPTSDSLDQMSNYADVPLGGIIRKVTLFRVPEAHVGAFHVSTPFDKAYRDATVVGGLSILNESGRPLSNGAVRVRLKDVDGKTICESEPVAAKVAAWSREEVPIRLPVKAPRQWNAEQPNLYSLELELRDGDKVVQTVAERIGFRQTEIKGSQIVINGRAVKVRGTCHHDSHPLMGRAVTPELEELDIRLMKEANLNSFRTSHYPPLPEMIQYADELGMYVEDEGSFCWTGATNDLRLTPRVMQLNCELVARDRNHPSVYIWSICNESRIGYGLWRSREWIQRADPSRPTTGSYHADGQMDVAVRHNPITAGEMDQIERDLKIPVIWDECWCIWQDIWGDYSELWIDPGIRDYYITRLPALFDRFMRSPVVQGTEIWAWSDDSFLLPNAGLEYGRGETPGHYSFEQYSMPGRGLAGDAQWGVVDGWRRRKPEFWHTKKLHSPIKLKDAPLAMPAGSTVSIEVENRYDFENLADLKIAWHLGSDSGVAKASIPPHQVGDLTIDLGRQVKPGEALELEFRDGRGIVDSFRLPFGKVTHAAPFAAVAPRPLETYATSMLNGESAYVVGNGFELGFGKEMGRLRRAVGFGRALLRSLPSLHIAPTGNPTRPLPDPLSWLPGSFDLKKDGPNYRVTVNGRYELFEGGYEYVIRPDGEVEAKASFIYHGDDVWVREVGTQFEVPKENDLLRWDREAEYSVYPADHIGRATGEARAFAAHGTGCPPKWEWSQDNSPLGSNDFRSTKRNVEWGWIGLPDGGPGVLVESGGKQNLRATVSEDRIVVTVTDFYDGIGSRYEWTANYGRGRLLKRGDRIEARVILKLVPGR